MSFKSVGRGGQWWEVRKQSFTKVAPPMRCYRWINFSRHELSGGVVGHLQMLPVSNDMTPGDSIPVKDRNCCF